jgi:hypothetical protein
VAFFYRSKSRTQITAIHHQFTTNSPRIDHQKTPHFRQPLQKSPAKTAKIDIQPLPKKNHKNKSAADK